MRLPGRFLDHQARRPDGQMPSSVGAARRTFRPPPLLGRRQALLTKCAIFVPRGKDQIDPARVNSILGEPVVQGRGLRFNPSSSIVAYDSDVALEIAAAAWGPCTVRAARMEAGLAL